MDDARCIIHNCFPRSEFFKKPFPNVPMMNNGPALLHKRAPNAAWRFVQDPASQKVEASFAPMGKPLRLPNMKPPENEGGKWKHFTKDFWIQAPILSQRPRPWSILEQMKKGKSDGIMEERQSVTAEAVSGITSSANSAIPMVRMVINMVKINFGKRLMNSPPSLCIFIAHRVFA